MYKMWNSFFNNSTKCAQLETNKSTSMISQVDPLQLLRFFKLKRQIRQFDLFDLKPTENHFKYTDSHSDLMDEIKYFCNEFEFIDVEQNNYKSEQTMLLEDIRNYDKTQLNKTNFQCDELPMNYMQRLKNTLELEIVEMRIKELGYNPEFSFTTKEYRRALTNLISNKNREIVYINAFFVLIGIVGLCTSDNSTKSMAGLLFISSFYNVLFFSNFSF